MIDGVCAGIWSRKKTAKRIELTVEPARRLTKAEREASKRRRSESARSSAWTCAQRGQVTDCYLASRAAAYLTHGDSDRHPPPRGRTGDRRRPTRAHEGRRRRHAPARHADRIHSPTASRSRLRDIATAAAIVGAFAAFDVTFETLEYFDGREAVLYLRAGAGGVRSCGASRRSSKPSRHYPPYGGAHPDHVPHMTVAVGERETLELFGARSGVATPARGTSRSRLALSAGCGGGWLRARRGSRSPADTGKRRPCCSTTARSRATVTRCACSSRISASSTSGARVDVVDRSNRRELLGDLNPALRVPTLVLDDGRSLGESGAILWFFGEGTRFVPDDAVRARAGAAVDVLRAVRPRAGDRGGAVLARVLRAARGVRAAARGADEGRLPRARRTGARPRPAATGSSATR